MDRGRPPDDGPDDVGAAPDHVTIDPTVDAGGSFAPSAASDDGPASGVGSNVEAEPQDSDASPADDDDARPAAWLADIRARAPWLLEPGGSLHWRVTGVPGPDIVPHGMAVPAASVGGPEAPGRTVPPAPGPLPASEPWARDRFGELGEGSEAGEAGTVDHRAVDAWPRWPDPTFETPAPLPGGLPPADGSRPGADAVTWPEAPDQDPDWSPAPLWPEDEAPRGKVSTTGSDAAGPAERPGTLADDLSPGPDLRRPAIRRPSATWPPSPTRPATASPVWPARPRPEGLGLPHSGPVPEPGRPPHRPVTPFVPEHPAPTSPAVRSPAPTWAEDRSGWHASTMPVSRIVDEATLTPWPSLLEDDDGNEDEPDWAALERGFERMLRLEREQRRR